MIDLDRFTAFFGMTEDRGFVVRLMRNDFEVVYKSIEIFEDSSFDLIVIDLECEDGELMSIAFNRNEVDYVNGHYERDCNPFKILLDLYDEFSENPSAKFFKLKTYALKID